MKKSAFVITAFAVISITSCDGPSSEQASNDLQVAKDESAPVELNSPTPPPTNNEAQCKEMVFYCKPTVLSDSYSNGNVIIPNPNGSEEYNKTTDEAKRKAI